MVLFYNPDRRLNESLPRAVSVLSSPLSLGAREYFALCAELVRRRVEDVHEVLAWDHDLLRNWVHHSRPIQQEAVSVLQVATLVFERADGQHPIRLFNKIHHVFRGLLVPATKYDYAVSSELVEAYVAKWLRQCDFKLCPGRVRVREHQFLDRCCDLILCVEAAHCQQPVLVRVDTRD